MSQIFKRLRGLSEFHTASSVVARKDIQVVESFNFAAFLTQMYLDLLFEMDLFMFQLMF